MSEHEHEHAPDPASEALEEAFNGIVQMGEFLGGARAQIIRQGFSEEAAEAILLESVRGSNLDKQRAIVELELEVAKANRLAQQWGRTGWSGR